MQRNNLYKLYAAGFIFSMALTIMAYHLVVYHLLPAMILLVTILVLAFVQLAVQLIFFLHLNQEKRPRWNLVMFITTFGLILIVVVGSIWIMNHLNYNMMSSPQQIEQYTQSQDGF